MSLFDALHQNLMTYLDPEQIDIIHRAYQLADAAHKHQSRKSGEPYITHPLEVAQILCDLRMDYQTITAAILHDTIEDTAIDKHHLAEEFGEEIANLVDGVSKLTQIEFTNRDEAQAENFRKMLLAMSHDIRVIIVKLADRLHNMRTLNGLAAHKRRQKAKETLDIYAPIASRLGMYGFKLELEDLGFAALHPWRFRIFQKALSALKEKNAPLIQKIESNLKKALSSQQLSPETVWFHQRHLYSLYHLMEQKHLSFSEIADFLSFRIVVDTQADCYRALGAIHQVYRPLPEHFKDYIALPKTNGYQALHTTLFGEKGQQIEIQIRSLEMNDKAEKGITAHWLFKHDHHSKEAQHFLQGLMELQEQNSHDAIEFIEHVKADLFPKDIFIFTPKGEILTLPQAATPVDFAYAIHSDIGNRCIAAKIDKRIAPLSTALNNGETVEIITAPGATPNPAWLNFVITSKAKSHIKNFLKDQNHEASVTLGKRLLKRTLKLSGQPLETLSSSSFKACLKKLGYKNKNALYESIGLGNQLASEIALLLTGNEDSQLPTKQKRSLIIKGTEGRVLRFAACCRPIPGDPISGFFETGKGIVVHLKSCPQALKLRREPERYLPVKWQEHPEGDFKVDIFVDAVNQRGVLAEIASEIAEVDANIEDLSVEQRDGNYCLINITLSVFNRNHLARVLRRLKSLKHVCRLGRREASK